MKNIVKIVIVAILSYFAFVHTTNAQQDSLSFADKMAAHKTELQTIQQQLQARQLDSARTQLTLSQQLAELKRLEYEVALLKLQSARHNLDNAQAQTGIDNAIQPAIKATTDKYKPTKSEKALTIAASVITGLGGTTLITATAVKLNFIYNGVYDSRESLAVNRAMFIGGGLGTVVGSSLFMAKGISVLIHKKLDKQVPVSNSAGW